MSRRSKYSLRGAIVEALKYARMTQCNFQETSLKPEFPLPKTEEDVNAFIIGRTKIWRETWLLPHLERALAKVESRDKKNAKAVQNVDRVHD